MKSLGILTIVLFLSLSAFAAETESKTFLVLFKSKELKSLNTSLKDIQSQFSSAFKIRSYAGNSELAMIINIPECEFDACFLGQFLVSLEKGEEMKLQEIAFRLVDMTANKKSLDNYLIAFEASQQKNKNDKRPTPAP
ncbi:hypothetical protein [Algoriphagus aquimarinus]|uniref:DUF4476 domain-containing protein n=1 Tax=Algoriphagus aquimarinus TaxID=237018 RepID=A0A5C7AIC7_9BACT|nr:hypothetical protein [Algoriphagus aquimarinus]TXE05572.1 hypothetical protein ESV85_17930 [Algoriphagus aquimarinus]|tara:strand:+ start:12885 stop:13298 length:414 start_codon:yes stop_codon:yes gene_type:complete